MLLSHLFDLCFALCGKDNYWQVSEQCNMIAWAYETGNYLLISRNGGYMACFYAFCNYDDVERIMKSNDYMEGLLVLARRQIRGDVIFPFLVCGKVDKIHKDMFKLHARALGAKRMIYYKSKLHKFYTVEV